MAKRLLCALCALCMVLCAVGAASEREVTYIEGTRYFPEEENWTYCYVYSYPHLSAGEDDVAAMMVNETLDTIMREMLELVMPMFSHADLMTENGRVTVYQTWEVTAVTPRLFSVLMTKKEESGGTEYGIIL